MKVTFPRSSYAPAGTGSVVYADAGLEVFSFERGGVPVAVGFFGNARKPTFHYRFRDAARREAYIAEQRRNLADTLARRAERAAARRSFQHTVKRG